MYKGYPTNWFRQVAKSWNINYTIYSMIVGYKGYVMIHPQFPKKSQQTTWRQAKPEHLDGRPHRVARHRHAGAIFKRRWMDAEWRCWCGHTACEDMWRYVKCSEVFGRTMLMTIWYHLCVLNDDQNVQTVRAWCCISFRAQMSSLLTEFDVQNKNEKYMHII